MGRSGMQGTPWHYETIPYKCRQSYSPKCGFSNKGKCECVASKQYGKRCIKKDCTSYCKV